MEVVQVVQVRRSWSRRGLETWRYGGCVGMEARYGGLEGVQVWRSGGRVGMEVWRRLEAAGSSGGGRRVWWRSEALEEVEGCEDGRKR